MTNTSLPARYFFENYINLHYKIVSLFFYFFQIETNEKLIIYIYFIPEEIFLFRR